MQVRVPLKFFFVFGTAPKKTIIWNHFIDAIFEMTQKPELLWIVRGQWWPVSQKYLYHHNGNCSNTLKWLQNKQWLTSTIKQKLLSEINQGLCDITCILLFGYQRKVSWDIFLGFRSVLCIRAVLRLFFRNKMLFSFSNVLSMWVQILCASQYSTNN